MKNVFLATLCLFTVLPVIAGNETKSIQVETSQGLMQVWDSGGNGPVVMLVHGNSASGKIFKKQFQALGKEYRLIAPDLPGHGGSSPARDPQACYSFPGYAKVLAEVIQKLDLKEVTVVGWSLGGHVALEMAILPTISLKGIVITGTPPISLTPAGFQKGFKPFEGLSLLGFENKFSEDQARLFMGLGGINMDQDEASFMIEDAMKTEGLARKYMIASLNAGVGTDETEIVKSMHVPLGIIAGRNDCGINNEYIAHEVEYSSLWRGEVQFIEDAGHAVFWENAEQFNKFLADFLESVWG